MNEFQRELAKRRARKQQQQQQELLDVKSDAKVEEDISVKQQQPSMEIQSESKSFSAEKYTDNSSPYAQDLNKRNSATALKECDKMASGKGIYQSDLMGETAKMEVTDFVENSVDSNRQKCVESTTVFPSVAVTQEKSNQIDLANSIEDLSGVRDGELIPSVFAVEKNNNSNTLSLHKLKMMLSDMQSRLKDTLTCDELTRLEQRFHLSDYRLRVHITLPYGEHELDKADSDHIYAVECSSSSASPSRRRIANNSSVSSSSSSSRYDESLRQLNYSQHLLDRSKSHYLAIASNSAHLIACCCPVVKRPKVKVIPQSTLRQPSPNRKPPQSPSTGSPSAALAKGFNQSMNPRIEIRQSPERQAASAPSSLAQSGGNRSGIQVGSKGNSPSLPVSKSSSSSTPHSTSPTGILGGGRRRSSHSPPNDNGASAALNTSISSTSSVSSRSRPQSAASKTSSTPPTVRAGASGSAGASVGGVSDSRPGSVEKPLSSRANSHDGGLGAPLKAARYQTPLREDDGHNKGSSSPSKAKATGTSTGNAIMNSSANATRRAITRSVPAIDVSIASVASASSTTSTITTSHSFSRSASSKVNSSSSIRSVNSASSAAFTPTGSRPRAASATSASSASRNAMAGSTPTATTAADRSRRGTTGQKQVSASKSSSTRQFASASSWSSSGAAAVSTPTSASALPSRSVATATTAAVRRRELLTQSEREREKVRKDGISYPQGPSYSGLLGSCDNRWIPAEGVLLPSRPNAAAAAAAAAKSVVGGSGAAVAAVGGGVRQSRSPQATKSAVPSTVSSSASRGVATPSAALAATVSRTQVAPMVSKYSSSKGRATEETQDNIRAEDSHNHSLSYSQSLSASRSRSNSELSGTHEAAAANPFQRSIDLAATTTITAAGAAALNRTAKTGEASSASFASLALSSVSRARSASASTISSIVSISTEEYSSITSASKSTQQTKAGISSPVSKKDGGDASVGSGYPVISMAPPTAKPRIPLGRNASNTSVASSSSAGSSASTPGSAARTIAGGGKGAHTGAIGAIGAVGAVGMQQGRVGKAASTSAGLTARPAYATSPAITQPALPPSSSSPFRNQQSGTKRGVNDGNGGSSLRGGVDLGSANRPPKSASSAAANSDRSGALAVPASSSMKPQAVVDRLLGIGLDRQRAEEMAEGYEDSSSNSEAVVTRASKNDQEKISPKRPAENPFMRLISF